MHVSIYPYVQCSLIDLLVNCVVFQVLPHEISVVTEQYYWELEAQMDGDVDNWVEDDGDDDEREDEDSANSTVSTYTSIYLALLCTYIGL